MCFISSVFIVTDQEEEEVNTTGKKVMKIKLFDWWPKRHNKEVKWLKEDKENFQCRDLNQTENFRQDLKRVVDASMKAKMTVLTTASGMETLVL